jgi:hypothetical protein
MRKYYIGLWANVSLDTSKEMLEKLESTIDFDHDEQDDCICIFTDEMVLGNDEDVDNTYEEFVFKLEELGFGIIESDYEIINEERC